MTGVYKALAANGETVDTARTEVAQQELETVNEVATAHTGDTNFDSSALDKAVAEIKTALADYKSPMVRWLLRLTSTPSSMMFWPKTVWKMSSQQMKFQN